MLHKFGLMLLAGLLLAGCQTPLELLSSPRVSQLLPSQGGFLYEITKPESGDTFYLFGTIHLSELNEKGKPAFPLKPSVLQALTSSDRLVVESYDTKPQPAPANNQPALAQPDATLQKLSSEGAAMLMAGDLKKLFELCRISYLPVDGYLLYLANKQGMPISGLETREERYRILAAAGEENKQSKLYQSLDVMRDAAKANWAALLQQQGEQIKEKTCPALRAPWESWKNQDVEAAQSKAQQQSQTDAFTRALLTERSKLFYERIQALLNQGGHPFVAVGTAHLYDQAGLVERFTAAGYTVTLQKW